MRKIISLIILITFLFTNTAHPLTTLRPPIDKDKERARKAANEAVYLKIARWINKNIGNKGDIETIVSELKGGKLVFEYKFKGSDEEPGYEFKVDFVRGFYSTYDLKSQGLYYGYDLDIYKRTMLRIPEDISKLASKILRKGQRPISEYGIGYLNQSSIDLISSIGEAWELRLKLDEKVTENIVKCLRSLGKNALTSALSKKIVTKKLLKLQQKIPQTIPIIREKALELVEIDRENFREGLRPFIIEYIDLRDAIRGAGIKDDTRDFYNLFDEIVAWMQAGQHEKELLASITFIEKTPKGYENFTVSDVSLGERRRKALSFIDYNKWVEIYLFKKKYGGFRVECEYTPAGMSYVTNWSKIYSDIQQKNKRSQGGRLSVYPEQTSQSGKIGYAPSNIKYMRTSHQPSAEFKIFPKINPERSFSGQHKDLRKIRSHV